MIDATMDKMTASRFDALLSLMRRLETMHDEFRRSLERKLEMLRTAQIEQVQVNIAAEEALAGRIREQEGLRKQLMEQLGRGFGMSPEIARSLPARKLAERLAEPYRGRLIQAAGGLKRAIEEVRKISHLIERVSVDVTRHLHHVFAAIRTTCEPSSGYTKRGDTVAGKPRELFLAIG